MLTEAQVAIARTFPGCGDITAENGMEKLFAAAETFKAQAAAPGTGDSLTVKSLQARVDQLQKQVPTETPAPILKAMAGAARTYMEFAVTKQAISPVVAEMLAARLIGTDDAPSPVGLTPSASGECVATAVFKVLAGNDPMPLVGANANEANAQRAPKVQTGAPDDGKPITAERLKALMELTPVGIAALAPPVNGNGR